MKKDETLGGIAGRHGITLERILELNQCKGDTILPNRPLKVCADLRPVLSGKESRGKESRGKAPRGKESRGKESLGKESLGDSQGKESQGKESLGDSQGKESRGKESLGDSQGEFKLPPPVPPICKSILGRGQQADARVVFMSNGNASVLFERYVSETKKAGISTEWDKVVVVFFGPGGQEYVRGQKPNFGEAMAGLTTLGVWKKNLKGKFAACRPNPVADANALGSDLVCEPAMHACK